MSATKKSIKDMADRLISTLDSLMPSEKADAIVRDVAEELYRDVLGIQGAIIIDQSQATGFIHGGFGKNGKRGVAAIARYKFEAKQ
ncbi:MAG TPA: hypothetical protein VNG32_00345 [Candidatus Dormibacteraeota bacterium]|nr:hypothetical protein [Candidatus Dormibacteraeota bacterium]